MKQQQKNKAKGKAEQSSLFQRQHIALEWGHELHLKVSSKNLVGKAHPTIPQRKLEPLSKVLPKKNEKRII